MTLAPAPSGKTAAYVGLIAGVLVLAFAAKVGAQGLTPGTVKLLSKNAPLVEAETAETFISLSPTEPAKFLIVGPAKLQADFRVSLPPGQPQGEPVLIDVYAVGKLLRRFKVTPKAGSTSWKDKVDAKPSSPVGFFLQIDPGPHAYEVRVTGAATGAAISLVQDSKAKRPLAANAPVVPPKPPAPVATPTPALAKATPLPTPKPKSLDELPAVGGRKADAPMERLAFELGVKSGVAIPLDDTFSAVPFAGLEARWSLGNGRLLGIGLEVTRMQLGGLDEDDPARADPPFALNVGLTPVIANATLWIPSNGRLRPYVAVGGGFVFAEMLYEDRTQKVSETAMGPAAQALAGLQIDLSPSEFREGKQKIFLEAKGTYLQAGVETHDYEDWSSIGVLAGVELKF